MSGATGRERQVGSDPGVERPDDRPWLRSAQGEAALRYRLAREAGRGWAARPVGERVARLRPLLAALETHMDRLAALIEAENGKPRTEALALDLGPAALAVRFALDRAERVLAARTERNPWLPHRAARVHQRPWGVVLVISPWNFPLGIPLGQVVAALVAGNAVVLKPSEETPRCGGAIAELIGACGLPEHLFSVVQGDGAVGAALVAARPDKVFFTGSVATGRAVMAAAAAHPTPVSLELGGVDALIVCEDADLELASSAIAWGANLNGGQVCASVERLLVHASVHTSLMARVLAKVALIDPDADLGRITADKQRLVYQRHLSDARRRGLQIRCGGAFLGARKLAPTVIEGQGIEQADVWCEESFGPLLAVATFRDDEEAIARHNATEFGLTASIFSASPSRAQAMAGRLQAGLVAINDVAATLYGSPQLPWGGSGQSGFGRSHGVEGLLECVRPQVIDAAVHPRLAFKPPWWFPYDSDTEALMRRFALAVATDSWRRRAVHAAAASAALVRQLARHPRH